MANLARDAVRFITRKNIEPDSGKLDLSILRYFCSVLLCFVLFSLYCVLLSLCCVLLSLWFFCHCFVLFPSPSQITPFTTPVTHLVLDISTAHERSRKTERKLRSSSAQAESQCDVRPLRAWENLAQIRGHPNCTTSKPSIAHPHPIFLGCSQKDKGRGTPRGYGDYHHGVSFLLLWIFSYVQILAFPRVPGEAGSKLSSGLYILTINLKWKPPTEGRWAADLFIGLEKPRMSQRTSLAYSLNTTQTFSWSQINPLIKGERVLKLNSLMPEYND